MEKVLRDVLCILKEVRTSVIGREDLEFFLKRIFLKEWMKVIGASI